jgi:hypothetical protein
VRQPPDDSSAASSVGPPVGDSVSRRDVGIIDGGSVGVAVGVSVAVRVDGISDG